MQDSVIPDDFKQAFVNSLIKNKNLGINTIVLFLIELSVDSISFN